MKLALSIPVIRRLRFCRDGKSIILNMIISGDLVSYDKCYDRFPLSLLSNIYLDTCNCIASV